MPLENFSDYLKTTKLNISDFNKEKDIQYPYFQSENFELIDLSLMKNIDFSILDDYMEDYLIDGDERPDTISIKLYGSSDYWWVNLVINQMSYYDLPLSEKSLKTLANDLYETEGIYSSVDNYYLVLKEVNDYKRKIKVIREDSLFSALRKLQNFMKSL